MKPDLESQILDAAEGDFRSRWMERIRFMVNAAQRQRDFEDRTRFLPACAFKGAKVDGDGVFEGYGSTFGGPPDAYGDVVAPGAFANSLDRHRKAGTRPLLLWMHDASEPIGTWQHIEEDARGLKVRGRLSLATQRGREAHALLKEGALNGLSIGFSIPKGGEEVLAGGAGFLLKEIDLAEISVVSMPANADARVTGVKQIQTVRDFENHLRDAGFSVRAARKLASGGWSALQGSGSLEREDDDDGLSAALASSRAHIEQITKAKA